MTVHVLDTGAVYDLLNRQSRSPLWKELEFAIDADPPHGIFIPSLVLVEVGQSNEVPQKRLQAIRDFCEVAILDEDLALRAAQALRSIDRQKCSEKKCEGFIGPSMTDAVVVVFAARRAEVDEEVYVRAKDDKDMERLGSHFGRAIKKPW